MGADGAGLPKGFVYKIQNTLNGKVYIGQTTRGIDDRWREHVRNSYRGKSSPLCDAIREFGPATFTVQELPHTKSLRSGEYEWIRYYNSMDPRFGYNVAGSGSEHSEERRRKMSVAMKRVWADPETRNKITKAIRGANTSDAVKKRRTRGQLVRMSQQAERSKIALSVTESWADPLTAQRHRLAIEKIKPDQSDRMRQRMSDPVTKAQLVAASKLALAHADVKVRQSERMRRRMADPKVKLEHAAKMKLAWVDPESRSKRIAAMKDAQSDPALRARKSEAMKRTWAKKNAKSRNSL